MKKLLCGLLAMVSISVFADSVMSVDKVYTLLNYKKSNNLGIQLQLSNGNKVSEIYGTYHSDYPYTNINLSTQPDENGVLVIPNPLPVPNRTQGIPASGEFTMVINGERYQFKFNITNNGNKDYYMYKLGTDGQLQTLYVDGMKICSNNSACHY